MRSAVPRCGDEEGSIGDDTPDYSAVNHVAHFFLDGEDSKVEKQNGDFGEEN